MLEREPALSSTLEVLDRVLDKGIVLDASARMTRVGIELVGLGVGVVVTSVQIHLAHADLVADLPPAAPAARTTERSTGTTAEPTTPLVTGTESSGLSGPPTVPADPETEEIPPEH